MKIVALFAALTLSAAAEQAPLRDLLRDGLYAEEITRDKEAAAKQYEQIVARFNEQRPFAANAFFRLAEIRRGQNRKEEAIALYQLVVTQFPDADPQANLARTQLAALGSPALPTNSSAADTTSDEETKELQRLTELVQTSPDRLKPLEEIPGAASKGWEKVSRFLVSRLEGTPKQDCLNIGLMCAAENGQLAQCRSLLEQGADPNGMNGGLTLSKAVWFDRVEVVKLLLEKGANPNHTPRSCPEPPAARGTEEFQALGSALHSAAYRTNLPLLKLLLDAGADASLAAPTSKFTPLHLWLLNAGSRGDASVAGVQMLLEKGAKPDAVAMVKEGKRIPIAYTPARYALYCRDSQEALPLLFEAGASAKDPALLHAAIRFFSNSNKDFALLRMILERGADPNSSNENFSALQVASTGRNAAPLLDLLIEKGARPDETWINSGFEGAIPAAQQLLCRHFLIPRLVAKPEITFLTHTPTKVVIQTLATKDTKPELSSIAQLLWEAEISWPVGSIQSNEGTEKEIWPETLLFWQQGKDQAPASQQAQLGNPGSFPSSAWGMVVEATTDQALEWRSLNYKTSLPSDLAWALRKTISIPITFEIAGKARKVTLRGDRLVYDPTSDQLPWTGAGYLASLLGQDIETPDSTSYNESKGTLVISRKGWPDIRMTYGDKGINEFPLQAGDHLKFEVDTSAQIERRKSRVTLIGTGVPYARQFGKRSTESSKAIDVTIPTLLQVLVETSAPLNRVRDLPNTPQQLCEWAIRQKDWDYSVLPHPDLSKIRIRRMQEDGSEKVIECHLAKIIEASSEQTSPQEARNADIPLQMGDIVEVPLLRERLGQPWKGFTEKENRFFAKALNCRVQVTSFNGVISMKEVSYSPTRFIETEGGIFPLPPITGTASLRVNSITDGDSVDEITRTSTTVHVSQGNINDAFLRDGDLIKCGSTPVRARGPRQRIIPPANR